MDKTLTDIDCGACSLYCYVRLHGYGWVDGVPNKDDWFIALAINGVVYVNASRLEPPCGRGLFTYLVHPTDCTADDVQYFHFFDDANESPRFINYLQSLADGRSLTFFSPFYNYSDWWWITFDGVGIQHCFHLRYVYGDW